MDIDDMVLEATYRAHGRAAAYLPPSGDPATDLVQDDHLVCFHQPPLERDSSGIRINEIGVAEKQVSLLVRSAQIARPEAQGTFTMTGTGKVFLIGEVVEHDGEGREWRCRVMDAA